MIYVKKRQEVKKMSNQSSQLATTSSNLNIYVKIQLCRVELQSMNLKKSGQNKYAGFSYYTLEDIAPPLNILLLKYGLTSNISFDNEKAILTIINTDNLAEQVSFDVPMREAEQKSCNKVQNLGATITYIRRYLYLIAFDIVEYDTFDAVSGKPNNNTNSNTSQELDFLRQKLTAEQIAVITNRNKVNDISELSPEIISAYARKLKNKGPSN